MTKPLKKVLPHGDLHEGIAEYFAECAEMNAPYPRKREMHQVIAAAMKAYAQDAEAEKKADPTASPDQQADQQTDHEPAHAPPRQMEIPAPSHSKGTHGTTHETEEEDDDGIPITPAEDDLYNFFHTLIVNDYSLPPTGQMADFDENLTPLISFDVLPDGDSAIVLMPYPPVAIIEPGKISEDMFEPGMQRLLEKLFFDLEDAAEKYGVGLIYYPEKQQFIIRYESALALLSTIEAAMKEKGIKFREELNAGDELDFDPFLPLDEVSSRDGKPYFGSEAEHQDYMRERLLFDHALTAGTGASNYQEHLDMMEYEGGYEGRPTLSAAEYFLDSMPPRIYIDFAEAARVTTAYQLYELRAPALEHSSLGRLKDALWQQDQTEPLPQINPLLRIH